MIDLSSIETRHFKLEQLAEGVYAAIQGEDGWAISNAGIVDLGDRTLVFDACMTPIAAADLCKAAKKLTGKPVRMVIDSHYHSDHIWGNQAFPPEADIISSAATRDLIAVEGPKEIEDFRQGGRQQLEAMQARWDSAPDEATRAQVKIYLLELQGVITSLPILQLRLPNISFTGEVVFTGSKRSARLVTYQGGHCASDTILHLPQDGIVFMGDILFMDAHPYLPECDPYALMQILSEVRELQAHIFIPGHGPVGRTGCLDWMDEYVDTLTALARQAVGQGMAEEELASIAMPEKYQHLIIPMFFLSNLKFLYRRESVK